MAQNTHLLLFHSAAPINRIDSTELKTLKNSVSAKELYNTGPNDLSSFQYPRSSLTENEWFYNLVNKLQTGSRCLPVGCWCSNEGHSVLCLPLVISKMCFYLTYLCDVIFSSIDASLILLLLDLTAPFYTAAPWVLFLL